MFHNLTKKLALVAVTATVGLGALTSPAHARYVANNDTDPKVQSVPEPTSMLGLLAFGSVAAVSSMRNKKPKA